MTEAETVTWTETHWGCQFRRLDGSVYITRWDPSYGTGNHQPYTEAEARADVARKDETGNMTKHLVTRTETTTVITTRWEEVK